MISNIIQVFLGIFIVLILLFIAYMVYNYERLDTLRNASNIKKKIPIFKGIYDYATHSDVEYNTYKETSNSYRNLIPSINQTGGAEYSYNFWLKIDATNIQRANSYGDDILLFLRGSKIQIPYRETTSKANCLLKTNGKYILVKNPLIRMKKDGTSIIIEYNTLSDPDAYRFDGNSLIKCDTGKWDDRNAGLLGIYDMNSSEYDNKWFMFTLVLKEITPENDILNKFKTSCKIFLNGIKMLDREVEAPYNGTTDGIPGSAAMKHNRAPLYLNPGNLLSNSATHTNNKIFTSTDDSPLQMADLSYYNYALDSDEIKSIFSYGFNKYPYTPPTNPGATLYPVANIDLNTTRTRVKPY